MMDEKKYSTFQFGKDDESPGTILQEELQELKIEKLSNRVTLLTILIPFMIGIILVIAYLDIKNRVTRTHNTEAISIEKISKDLQTKFSSLSLEQAKIKDIQSQKILSFEKSIDVLQSRLKTILPVLKQLESSAIGRDELSQVIESLNEKNQEISDSMQVEIETLKNIGNQMAKDVESVSNNLYTLSEALTVMKGGLDKLNEDISNLTHVKIGKKELDLALKLKEIGHRQELLAFRTSIDEKIDTIQNQLINLQPNNSQAKTDQTKATEKVEMPVKLETKLKTEISTPDTDNLAFQSTTLAPPSPGSVEEYNLE
jgi:chromosome segregation ATPase